MVPGTIGPPFSQSQPQTQLLYFLLANYYVMYLYCLCALVFVCVHACASENTGACYKEYVYVGVRGQLMGFCSLLPLCGARGVQLKSSAWVTCTINY